MSATFIAMFIILGALLSVTGAGKTFIDLAIALTGRFTGGPAKTAVVSSAMFGMISGSSVANVMVTGNYTIPDDEETRIRARILQEPWRPSPPQAEASHRRS